MTLQSGQRLGPYEIIGALGEGGMGQVYRARDTKLDREVAIKVLPPQVANDASALARFEREAKAVAALSHPNILAIHDFGSIDDTTFAVTELLEGETLRDRMAEGALGPRKAAELGSQIARGLGAAHEKGVIHRDLKPENVMITRDGHAKILDFGLAARAEEGAEADDGKTQTSLTSPGTVMGTVGYMAPEQVRAKPTDARTDIFSFGTVLYEMLTGRRAFQHETNAETMTAILREEPAELSSSGLSVPPTIAGEREILIEGTRELAQVSVSPDGKWVAMMDRGVEEDIVVAATDGNGVRRLTNDSFKDRQPVWTSDSRRIVFFSDRSGRYQAWWVGVEGGGLEQLTDVQEELLFNPFVSPDGGTLLYQSFGGGKRVDLAAPHPVRTAEPLPRLPDDRGFVAWDWSPDGTRIVGAAADELYSGGLWLLHTADDRFEKLTDDGILGRFLPDSRTVLYGWNRGVRLIDVASRESRVLHAAGPAESPLGLSYDSDGRHLYATSFETQGDVWLLRAATE